jgi:hypothetical protein
MAMLAGLLMAHMSCVGQQQQHRHHRRHSVRAAANRRRPPATLAGKMAGRTLALKHFMGRDRYHTR